MYFGVLLYLVLFSFLCVPSVLWHCLLGHLIRKNLSPIWPVLFNGTLSLTQSINHLFPESEHFQWKNKNYTARLISVGKQQIPYLGSKFCSTLSSLVIVCVCVSVWFRHTWDVCHCRTLLCCKTSTTSWGPLLASAIVR